jgi:hypothetical protein
MYDVMLITHSWLRWLVLGTGVAVLIGSAIGLMKSTEWSKRDSAIQASWVGFMDLNMLLGIGLYAGVSPITKAAFQDMGSAMGDATLRFFAVEHLMMMLLAVIVAHVGRVLTKKRERKHRISLISAVISMLLLLAGIPWPFMHDRPLFRLGM